MWQRFEKAQGLKPIERFKSALTANCDTSGVFRQPLHAHPLRQALAPAAFRPGWRSAGVLALLCSTVAWASLPSLDGVHGGEQRQWQALAIAPLSSGGTTLALAAAVTSGDASDTGGGWLLKWLFNLLAAAGVAGLSYWFWRHLPKGARMTLPAKLAA